MVERARALSKAVQEIVAHLYGLGRRSWSVMVVIGSDAPNPNLVGQLVPFLRVEWVSEPLLRERTISHISKFDVVIWLQTEDGATLILPSREHLHPDVKLFVINLAGEWQEIPFS